ncbi:MAG: PilZ domain-containing protein [Bdellovibrionales bacterium]|nr:PilZ domain-containing protein [Bdellovibrionales bacterium]
MGAFPFEGRSQTAGRQHELSVRIARTRDELERAFALLHDHYVARGLSKAHPSGLWLNKFLLLPSTTTVIAESAGEVVGALVLIAGGAFGTPAEEQHLISRRQLEELGSYRRVAEVSPLAVSKGNEPLAALPLLKFAFEYALTYCQLDVLITQAWSTQSASFWKKLEFLPLPTSAESRVTLLVKRTKEALHLLPESDFGYAKFEWPERNFFRVNDPVLTADLADHFFNRKSRVLSELSDKELRAVKNIYSFGDHAGILPQRNVDKEFARLPRHQRFDVTCDGTLLTRKGAPVHFEVADVSVGGLRIRCDEHLDHGTVYALQINTGIWHKSEILARLVWVSDTDSYGFEIQSHDPAWARMIEHLARVHKTQKSASGVP